MAPGQPDADFQHHHSRARRTLPHHGHLGREEETTGSASRFAVTGLPKQFQRECRSRMPGLIWRRAAHFRRRRRCAGTSPNRASPEHGLRLRDTVLPRVHSGTARLATRSRSASRTASLSTSSWPARSPRAPATRRFSSALSVAAVTARSTATGLATSATSWRMAAICLIGSIPTRTYDVSMRRRLRRKPLS